jgi:DNA polymerase I-like protein with 3'-5' exonuclease and polymerase domains
LIFEPPVIPEDQKTIVYDVETDGVDWKVNKICGYVITLGPKPEQTYYFPVRHAGGGSHNHNYDPEEVATWIQKEIGDRKDIRLVGHSLKFDLHMSRNEGIVFHNHRYECTQANAALLDENAAAYSLSAVAKRMGAVEKKGDLLYEHLAVCFGGKAERKQMGNYWRLQGNDKLGVEYAKGDGVTTWAVWDIQNKHIIEQDLQRIHDLECRVTRTLFRMERRGVRIDVEKLDQMVKKIGLDLVIAKEFLPEGFNPRSKLEMRKLMEEHKQLDWPLTKPSKTFPQGQPSFSKEWLLTHDIGKRVVAVRELEHMTASFLNPMRDTHTFEGRVYATFNQMKMDDYGTVSGRLSSSNPNLQQIPKRNKALAILFRAIFLPEEGHTWSSNDYRQQEVVIFAEYTQAPVLVEGYQNDPNFDAHQLVADMLTKETGTKYDRSTHGKTINLAQIYGLGKEKMAIKIGTTVEKATHLLTVYHRLLPEVKTFTKNAGNKARNRGWVMTILGRKRRFPNSQLSYQAINQIIQGSSADITKLKMVEVDDYFEKESHDEAGLMIQVHDDLNWTVPDTEQGREWDAKAKEIMESFTEDDLITLSIPLRVDHFSGADWAEASFPKKE